MNEDKRAVHLQLVNLRPQCALQQVLFQWRSIMNRGEWWRLPRFFIDRCFWSFVKCYSLNSPKIKPANRGLLESPRGGTFAPSICEVTLRNRWAYLCILSWREDLITGYLMQSAVKRMWSLKNSDDLQEVNRRTWGVTPSPLSLTPWCLAYCTQMLHN